MKYTNIKKLLIKFMGGGLINFPTRFLRWVKIDGTANEEDGDGGDGGDDSECLAFLNNAKSLIENTYGFTWDGSVYPISDYDEQQFDDEDTINIGNKETAEYFITYYQSDTYYGNLFVTGDELDIIKCLVDIEKCKHHWIDLGLPSGKLWADTNVGSWEPNNYDYYFTNGILYPINEFSPNIINYFTYNEDLHIPDPAEFYSIPSKADFEELVENTIQEVYELEGTRGIKFTSKVNSEFIFIPFSGGYNSSTPDTPIPDNPTYAYILTNTYTGQYVYCFIISDGTGGTELTYFEVQYISNAGQIRPCISGPNTNS